MNIELSNHIRITEMPAEFHQELQKILTFSNPAYEEAVKRGRWTGTIPCVLSYFRPEADGTIIIPRGFMGQINYLAGQRSEPVTLIDYRWTLPEVQFQFQGKLRDYQREAVKDVLLKDFGTLAAPTGSGKTTMALAIIAARKQPALVIVHTKELMQQWIDRASQFLGIEPDEIGQIGSGQRRIGERLTVGIVNSIYPIADEIKHHFGFLIVDECHHCPSRTFSEAVTAFDARFMLGLSATPSRRDGLARLIFWHLGGLVHTVSKNHLEKTGAIISAQVYERLTSFRPSNDMAIYWSKGISELTLDGPRNTQIAGDISDFLKDASGPVLVLSDRKTHCETLQGMLRDRGVKAELLTGTLTANRRTSAMERIRAGEVEVICATGSLAGEGLDIPELEGLFIATPLTYTGRLTQYIGRVLRPSPGKKQAVIFDYVDSDGVLLASAQKRHDLYKKNGWTIHTNIPKSSNARII